MALKFFLAPPETLHSCGEVSWSLEELLFFVYATKNSFRKQSYDSFSKFSS